jgi:hypothetical protein
MTSHHELRKQFQIERKMVDFCEARIFGGLLCNYQMGQDILGSAWDDQPLGDPTWNGFPGAGKGGVEV